MAQVIHTVYEYNQFFSNSFLNSGIEVINRNTRDIPNNVLFYVSGNTHPSLQNIKIFMICKYGGFVFVLFFLIRFVWMKLIPSFKNDEHYAPVVFMILSYSQHFCCEIPLDKIIKSKDSSPARNSMKNLYEKMLASLTLYSLYFGWPSLTFPDLYVLIVRV